MLRTTLFACATVVAIAGSASAGVVSESLFYGGAIFPMHSTGTMVDDPLFEAKLNPATAGTDIIGFRVTFDYDEQIADASWASDAAMQFDFDGMFTVNLAGNFGGMGRLGGVADDIWDFDGAGSTGPGTYSHTFTFNSPVATPNSLTLFLTDTFNGGNSFLNITVDLLVPTPGAAALLGFAGLAATRRRR